MHHYVVYIDYVLTAIHNGCTNTLIVARTAYPLYASVLLIVLPVYVLHIMHYITLVDSSTLPHGMV